MSQKATTQTAVPPHAVPPQPSNSQKKKLRKKKAQTKLKQVDESAESDEHAVREDGTTKSSGKTCSGCGGVSNSTSSADGRWVDVHTPLTKNQKKKAAKKRAAARKKTAEQTPAEAEPTQMSQDQLKDLIDKAKSSMQQAQSGTGEEQVAGAMQALEHITRVLRQTRGGESGVQAALDAAKQEYDNKHSK